MEIGFIVKYGKLVPGRETQAIAVFNETKEWLEERRSEGMISYFEPFFYTSGNLEIETGFWLIKGERDKIWRLTEDETYRWLLVKAQFVVDHLEVEWLTVGDGIAEQIDRTVKAAAEFAVH